jgi:hypothetical protein
LTSATGQRSPKTLRLAAARRKVRAFLDQIADLEGSDFPHADGHEALLLLKQEFAMRQRALERIPPTVSDDVVDEVCAETSVFLSRYTDILGFVLRSTNVRNAFEVHFPLKRLIQKVISPEAKLVMSSEWNFVPFTWPMNLDVLNNFVLVGGPAPESGNVLIIPLAGHEIGHSAWRNAGIANRIGARLFTAVQRVIDARPTDRDRIVENLQRAGHDLSYLQHAAFASARKQLEEIFCDMFALYVFGPSFAFAYEYFLAPGKGARSIAYPSSHKRVHYLLDGASTLGLDVDGADLFANWRDSTTPGGVHGDVLLFADEAVDAMFPSARDLAFEILRQSNVPMCDANAIGRVRDSLEKGVPEGSGATLAEIVTAGWQHLRARGGLAGDDDQQELAMLNELMLKSVEVSEFKLRVELA